MSWAPKPSADGFRYYNKWAGNPDGHREDVTRCIEQVSVPGIYQMSQCSRKRGYGPGGLYCKQHDPDAVKARAAASKAKYEAALAAKMRPHDERRAYRAALEEIANGCNDARGIAEATLKAWGR